MQNQFIMLVEETMDNPKLVVVYYGRFQPSTIAHISVYNHLTQKFGKGNVYIGTSNKVEPQKSPLSFQWKQKILRSQGVPANKIVQTTKNYSVEDIQGRLRFDADNTVFIVAIGEKDKSRLGGGKYYLPYKGGSKYYPASERAYYYIVPNVKLDDKVLSATKVRKVLKKGDDEFTKDDYNYIKKATGLSRALIDNIKPLFEHYIEDDVELITEGGKAGHMDHPWNDLDLKFVDMRNMISIALDGSISRQEV